MEAHGKQAVGGREPQEQTEAIGTGVVVPPQNATDGKALHEPAHDRTQSQASSSSSSYQGAIAEKVESQQSTSYAGRHSSTSDEGTDVGDGVDDVVHNVPTRPDSAPAGRTLTTVSTNSPPYTVFTPGQRKFIIFMASWAGFFSPVSANIYYPALNTLAADLKVSTTLINLTVTSYMIFQGLSPMFLGNFADAAGRRPAYLIGFVIYIGANIGLALQNNYAALFVLRCVQSTGSSPTVALAYGTVADTTTSANRGVAMGFATAGSLLGPSLGPIIGGLLSQYLGWRAIFWFLAIFVGAFMIIFIIFMPETGRRIVGNGSIKPPPLNMSVVNYLALRKARHPLSPEEEEEAARVRASRPPIRFPNPMNAIKICFELEAGLILFFNAIVFSAFYQVTTGITSQFKLIYGFDDLYIGLCYLPFGSGCTLAALINGKILDINYRRLAKKHNLIITRNKQQDLRDFPIERARIQVLLPMVYIMAASFIAFAWVLQYELPLYAPLIVTFFMGYCSSSCTGVCNNLIVDLYPHSPSTATAANNLYRCLIGAGATAVVIPMIDAMGRGWTYTFDALVLIALTPIVWLVMVRGPKWREEKRVRDEKVKAEKERDAENGESEKSR